MLTKINVPKVGDLEVKTHNSRDPYISGCIQLGNIFQPDLLRVLSVLIRPGDRFIDVGANIGWFAMIGSRLVGLSGKVYALEPDPENFALLQENARVNNCINLKTWRLGAGDRRSRLKLNLSEDNRGDHRISSAAIKDRETIDVDVTSIDRLLWLNRWLDVVLLDTQGSEVHVLRGMKRALRRNNKLRMIFEFWPHGLESCGSTAAELVAIVNNNGWLLWRLDENQPPKQILAHELLVMSQTDLNPASMKHTDILALSPHDFDAISAIGILSETT